MLEPGQIFAVRYRVIRLLAKGGMGAVFEAVHTGTERRVAIKLLWPQIMAVASAREKFELEAKVAARVNSEHIVHVSDAGFDEQSQSPYLVMELLEGETLASRVQDHGPLDSAEALPLLEQVAAGLDAAHGYKDERGVRSPIVHRDLKPENLFVTRQRGAPLMKILDFGIAKVLSESTNVSHEVKGTPLYMAYEQVSAGVLSPQTDIWALGLIAYYVLTGRRYWRSANTPGAGVQSIFGEILSLPMDPPSIRLRQQGSDLELPGAFDDWLLECLDRDPRRRPASAGEAVSQLARALGGARGPARAALRAPRKDAADPPIGMGATATFHGAQRAASTAASLPAVASERSPGALTFSVTPRRLALAGLGLGLPLVAALLWLLLEEDPGGGSAAQPVTAVPVQPAPAATTPPTPAPLPPPVQPPPVQPSQPQPSQAQPSQAQPSQQPSALPPSPAPTIRPVLPESPAVVPPPPPPPQPAPVDKSQTRTREERNKILRDAAGVAPRDATKNTAPTQTRPKPPVDPYNDTGFGKR